MVRLVDGGIMNGGIMNHGDTNHGDINHDGMNHGDMNHGGIVHGGNKDPTTNPANQSVGAFALDPGILYRKKHPVFAK